MENLFKEFFEKLSETGEKLTKGSQIFGNVDELEIGASEKELVWSMDKVRLFHYKTSEEPKIKTPVIVSYALINRYYMMDLQPDRSLFRKLLSLGLDIYVLDTGYPTRNERYLTMNDYINGYLDEAVDFIRESRKLDKINIMGICQGGTFTCIYSALHPEKIQNMVTLVTPVDFSTRDGLLFTWAQDMDIDAMVDGFGGLIPGHFLDQGFKMLKPMLQVRKQKTIYDIMDKEDKVMNFLRMEKWINDMPDQAGETYRQFIKDLYQQNKLVKGELVIGEDQVDLKNITMPVLTIYASEDHLVPPSSTKPLNELVGAEDKTLYEFPGGHIGVFTGRRSQAELGPRIIEWLEARDTKASPKKKAKASKASQPTSPKTDSPKVEVSAEPPKETKKAPAEKKSTQAKVAEAQPKPAPKSKKEELLDKIKERAKDFDFSKIGKAQADSKDDLKKIGGVGPQMEEKLNTLGIFTYQQLANMGPEEIQKLTEAIEFTAGKIEKDNWVEQAKQLLSPSPAK